MTLNPGMSSKPDMLAAAGELAERVKAREWEGGIRIVLQGSMRAVTKPGGVDLEAGFRADVFYDTRSRRPAFTLVAETPQQVLRDLAALLDDQA